MGRQACYGEWLSVCQRRSEKSTIAFQGCPFAPSFRRSSKICSVTNSEQRIIRMLLGRAAEAARNEDWASVRELVAAILRFDAENPDAKIFLEMANAPPALDVQPSDRIPPTSSRLSSSPGDLPESYPRPDRSDFIRYRRKAPSNEVVDIGWSEGVFETGRPYRVEYWQQDGVTYASFIFSTVSLENAAESGLRDLLTDEGLIEIIAADRQQTQSPYRGAAQFFDAATNRMWKVNVVLRDEAGAVAECTPEIHPYPREASADLSEVDLSYEEALVSLEETLTEADAELMRDIDRALDSTETFDATEEAGLRFARSRRSGSRRGHAKGDRYGSESSVSAGICPA